MFSIGPERNHDISIISSHTINKIVNETHAKGFVPGINNKTKKTI
jgi:hypothetical protein